MGSYTFRWSHHAQEVFVTGTFDNWSKSERLERVNGGFEKLVNLRSADEKILYKFVVDGHWTADYGLACENDGSGNVNNVLYPHDLTRRTEPQQSSSLGHMPGEFPETPAVESSSFFNPQQSYGVNPIPATSGFSNPTTIPEDEEVPHPSNFTSNTVDSTVTLDQESYERSDRYPGSESQQSYGISPLPATSGFSNPISIGAGEALPHHSNYTANTIDSNVTLDRESYERSDRYPGSAPTGNDGTRDAFAIPPIASQMIPESSLPMGTNASQGLEQDTSPFVSSSAGPGTSSAFLAGQVPKVSKSTPYFSSSAGEETSTASLAGQVPRESEGVPSVVSESQREANVDPEASSSAEAVSEKREVEDELLSKVKTEEPTSEGIGASVNSAAAERNPTEPAPGVPQVVAESQYDANQTPEASGNAEAVTDKESMEAELKSKVPEEPATSESASGIAKIAAAGTAAVVASGEAIVHSGAAQAIVHSGAAQAIVNSGAAIVHSGAALAQTATSWMPASIQQAISDMNHGKNPLTTHHESTMQTGAGATSDSAIQSSGDDTSGVPSTVTDSYSQAHQSPEAVANPEAVTEKSAVERELLQEVPESQETGASAPNYSADSATSETENLPMAVSSSYAKANESLEAAGNPEAVSEKSAVERELLRDVPESQETGQSAPQYGTDASTTAMEFVPAAVSDSYAQAQRDPEAASNPEAVADKSAVERELLQDVPESQETGQSAPQYGTDASTTAMESVPAAVSDSYAQAQRDPEAAAYPEAVTEKSAVERELLEEVPRNDESGEPAPTDSAALSSTAPNVTSETPVDSAAFSSSAPNPTSERQTDGATLSSTVQDTTASETTTSGYLPQSSTFMSTQSTSETLPIREAEHATTGRVIATSGMAFNEAPGSVLARVFGAPAEPLGASTTTSPTVSGAYTNTLSSYVPIGAATSMPVQSEASTTTSLPSYPETGAFSIPGLSNNSVSREITETEDTTTSVPAQTDTTDVDMISSSQPTDTGVSTYNTQATEATMPSQTETSMSSYTEASMPSQMETSMPSQMETSMPPQTETNMPSHTETSMPSYTETSMPSYTETTATSIPAETSMPSYAETSATSIPAETSMSSYAELAPTSIPGKMETRSPIPSMQTSIAPTPVETTSSLPSTTTAIPAFAQEAPASTSATTSGLNAPASAPAKSLATENKQSVTGGTSTRNTPTTTPKQAEASKSTSSGFASAKSLIGSKRQSMSQAIRQTRQDSRDISPHNRSAATAAAAAAAAAAASSSTSVPAASPAATKTGWQSAAQTPERTKASAPATSSAGTSPAAASSSSGAGASGSAAAQTKEDKRRKRTSFFGKLKEKFGSHK